MRTCLADEEATYHGSESSACTGRFAALRFPLLVSPLNLIDLSATAGASMSISSSKSDMLGELGISGRL